MCSIFLGFDAQTCNLAQHTVAVKTVRLCFVLATKTPDARRGFRSFSCSCLSENKVVDPEGQTLKNFVPSTG